MNAGGLGWKQGQPWSLRFDDRYFAADSGLEETVHVFLRGNRLPQRLAMLPAGHTFRIGETGFGTGLNFLCAWQLFEGVAPPETRLDFHSVEAFPLDADALRRALALWPSLQRHAQALLQAWPGAAPGRNRLPLGDGRVRLLLDIDDAGAALPGWAGAGIDAWFLDGFAPARNPAMWSGAVLAAAARASAGTATFATYTSAGWVRRGLQRAGFEVQRVPGFGRKREMLVGRLAGAPSEPG
jgi:tRNA 5-methylaminomethyl-2-thiouridine biosynthesis bifunctional protein